MTDDAIVALVGAGVGALVSLLTALLAPWLSQRFAERRFREELAIKRLDEIAIVMDDGGLALERFHWALQSAIDGATRAGAEDWERRRAEVEAARSGASHVGSRLAIRLGSQHREFVGVYDTFQKAYREIGREILDESRGDLNLSALRDRLEKLHNHTDYFAGAEETRDSVEESLKRSGARPRHRPSYGGQRRTRAS
jgi:hypothetical protein